MSETKRSRTVQFHETAKPPNYGAMKIHTKPTVNKDIELILSQPNYGIMQIHAKSTVNKDIVLIMSQTNSTREVAIEVYNKFDGDIVNSIMYILEEPMDI